MEPDDLVRQIESLAALEDPVRRKLYFYVAGRRGEVSREEAARAVHISRPLAAHHLDKLLEAGLLEASFRRLGRRTGPGAGRPSKLYRRAAAGLDVSLPARRYELAAHVFAQALAESAGNGGWEALEKAARDWGSRLARQPALRSRQGQPLTRAAHALALCGYEPVRTPEGELVLRNCPFDSLRTECRELTCTMNLALIESLLAGLELDGVRAKLAPREGMCCVALAEAAPRE